jgi:hypothetical protein
MAQPVDLTIGTPDYDRMRHFPIPRGKMVGSTGAGTCIGLIIVSPPNIVGHRCAWVYHFTAQHDPVATLRIDGGFFGRGFPKGSRAIIFGGHGNDMWSMGTLVSVHKYLINSSRITIVGVYNSTNLWVDADGKFHAFNTQTTVRDNDGSLPLPGSPQPNVPRHVPRGNH